MIHRRLFHQMKEHSLDMDAWMTQHDRSTPRLRNLGKSDTVTTVTLQMNVALGAFARRPPSLVLIPRIETDQVGPIRAWQ